MLAIRDNEITEVPQEIGELINLRELHLQGNRLQVLPPQVRTDKEACLKLILAMEIEGETLVADGSDFDKVLEGKTRFQNANRRSTSEKHSLEDNPSVL